jgi:hypothetical protein
MAPVSIIDYIVVHELCHLKIKNHSSDFWKLVSLALPDYQERREWLKTNTPLLKLDDFVKSPSAVLRFIFSHSDVPISTPHS